MEKGKIQHILVGFRTPCGKLTTTCRHDCAIRYMTASRVLTSGILKILNLSEILPVYLVPCLCGNLPTTNTAYFVGFRGHRKLLHISGKFATEFGKICGRKLWSLEITIHTNIICMVLFAVTLMKMEQ